MLLSGATNYAESVDNYMIVVVIAFVIILFGVTAAMIYFVVKYNRKKHPKAKQIEGHIGLEILWIGIPTILVLIMFWYGYEGYNNLRQDATAAMTVNVTGRMWEWSFKYENDKKTDTLYVPVNRTTKLEMISADVNHSLYIPAFRLKEDVIGSRTTYMILKPKEVGAYDIACAEYCGVNHAYMYTKLVVLPEDVFDSWLESDAVSAAIPDEIMDKKSKDIFENDESSIEEINEADALALLKEKGCITCHSTDGSQKIGPSFKNLESGKVVVIAEEEEKEITIDEDYLRRAIMDPNADIVKGYTKYMMPDNKGKISDEELELMVKYLKSIVNN